MAECVIGGARFTRLGAAACPGLRRLRRGRDQMRDKIRVGAAGDAGICGGFIGFGDGNQRVAQGHLLSRYGTFATVPPLPRKLRAASPDPPTSEGGSATFRIV